ncbi:MAG: ABC transporter permease, partial [Planctomycetota bacterium]|nr:ABC transporter permease [Planctomycetota bacterium]
MNRERARRLVANLFPWILFALAVALVFSRLPNARSILSLWRPWGEIGILALGMTAVLLTGGIDLSVGSIVTLSGMTLGLLNQRAGWPLVAAAIAAVITGTLAGAINGLLVIMGIVPLLATLATMALYAGLAMALSEGERIAGFPAEFGQLGQSTIAGIPSQLGLLCVACVVLGLLIHGTRFGRALFVIGDNRRGAEFAAVPVRKVEAGLYALNGFLAGLVAVWFTARRGAAVPDAGLGLELQTIACVVLGGTRVTGGSGGVGRTLLGLGVLANLEIGLRLWGNQSLGIPGTPLVFVLNANARLI